MLETVRNNPWPVALLATAAVGLMVRALKNGKAHRPKAAPSFHDSSEQPRGGRHNMATSRRGNSRLLAAAGVGAACWAIWRAQASAPHFGDGYPNAASTRDGGL
jgi:hypothetical protein